MSCNMSMCDTEIDIEQSGHVSRRGTQNGKMEELSEKCQRALKLMSDLEKLREESFQCDFEIRIDGKRFPVHRSVLAASSNYFKAMLKTDMKEVNQGYVEMKGLEVEAVKACLAYLYSGEIDLNFDEIEPIMKASDMMRIEDLKARLFGYAIKNISVDNCLQIRHYATTYNSEKDKIASENFIAENFAAVSKTDQFKYLDKTQLQECLNLFKETSKQAMNDAVVDSCRASVRKQKRRARKESYWTEIAYKAPEQMEATASSTSTQWQAITNWVEFNRTKRGEHLLKLLRSIEPLDISAVFSCVLADPLISARKECVEFIVQQAVLPNVHCIGNYISVENCFNLKRWAKQYESNDLKITVHDFMMTNFQAVANSERIVEFDLEEIQAIMLDQRTTRFDEQLRYQVIICWTQARQAERLKYFEDLFGLLNLNRFHPDFIHNTVRNEPLVKSRSACYEKIMDALYAYTKGANYAWR